MNHDRSDENKPPAAARGATPQDEHSQQLAAALGAALAAAAARGLDSALLTSWGAQTQATPKPPAAKHADSPARGAGGPIGRRVLLSDSATTFSSISSVLDLTLAEATPMHGTGSSRVSMPTLPVADIGALAELIGHTTGTSNPGKKQRMQRERSAGKPITERSNARGSSLLPQFTKGFSLYMKRWNPSYYFGPPPADASAASPSAPAPAAHRAPPAKATTAIVGVGHQSLWAAAAEAAKEKIASIEAEHARRRSVVEPKLIQVRMRERAELRRAADAAFFAKRKIVTIYAGSLRCAPHAAERTAT